MAKIRSVAIGEKAWKDARGWVLNPLPLAGLEGKTAGQSSRGIDAARGRPR